jgi:hypothetical protein
LTLQHSDEQKEPSMSFDVFAAACDQEFWKSFSRKYKTELLAAGWNGPLQAGGVEDPENHDVLSNVLFDAVHKDGKQMRFDEAEAEEDIPGGGGSDFASIKKLCGRFFVTGSYMNAGPFDSEDEAADAAGLNG